MEEKDRAADPSGEAIIARVDALLDEAVRRRASDLYIEPAGGAYRLRVRRDGLFEDIGRATAPVAERLIARVKVMARLAVHRTSVPQEGRLKLTGGVEARVSVVPTVSGERAVLRFLGAAGAFELDDLGLAPELVAAWRALLARPQGVLFVCGPAGSGKTTTLYASLAAILRADGDRRSICTLEDPVERNLGDIAQTEIDPAWDLDFAAGLKAILRQDPDVLLIGEVRDAETARIGLQAGLTGHLVLSSLHTSSAVEALARLSDLGAPAGVIASGLKALLVQRLVRVAGGGGRRAIGELMVLDARLRRLVRRGASPGLIARAARRAGWRPLVEVAREQARAGELDPADVARLVREEELA